MTRTPTSLATGIELDERDIAWLADTQVKVLEIALDKIAHGWSAEEMHFQHPHLSLAQIHCALAYYYENKQKVEEQIREAEQDAEKMIAEFANPELRRKIAALKLPR